VSGLQRERKIPKNAVKPLIEYCQKLSGETGKSAAEIFKEFLRLMKKYGDYFFSEPWPEKLVRRLEFSDVDEDFVRGARNYSEECERFTVVCLRRNISLEGFDAEGFEEDFDWHEKRACWHCVIPDAVSVREEIRRLEEAIKKNEEEMRQKEPSWIAKEMYNYYRRPDVVRLNKMRYVELKVYEELGLAEGKSCDVRNKYKCPYGEQADELIENGRFAKFVWGVVEWYDHHWNPSHTFRPSADEMKWYHYDEPSIIDVTNYEDVLKAIKDGRLEKIIEERKRWEEEHKE
jgi:hypothetical protein